MKGRVDTKAPIVGRRTALRGTVGVLGVLGGGRSSPAAALHSPPPLSPRLGSSSVELLSEVVPSRVAELRYPSYMIGTWRVRNTLRQFSMPLGSRFLDPFVAAVAQEDLASASTLTYLLRWVAAPRAEQGSPRPELALEPVSTMLTPAKMAAAAQPGAMELGAVQDRAFNAREETDAFLGADGGVVGACTYVVDAAHPHGALRLEVLEPRDDGAPALARDAAGAAARARGAASDESAQAAPTSIDLDIEWTQWDEVRAGEEGIHRSAK